MKPLEIVLCKPKIYFFSLQDKRSSYKTSMKKPVSSLDPIVTHCADQAFTNKLHYLLNNENTTEKEKDCSVILEN